MAKLRTEGEALATGMSNCASPISSWMSDLSMGSEADQSLHSFSQSLSQQGEALADPEPSFGVESLDNYESGGSPRRGSLEGELASDKESPTKDRLRKLSASMNKTNIQILLGPGTLSSFKSTIKVHPCAAVKPMILKEPTIISSSTKTASLKDPVKSNAAVIASISSEMSFEDPWLKRGIEEGKTKELVCEVKPEKREVQSVKSQTGGGSEDHQSLCKDGKRH